MRTFKNGISVSVILLLALKISVYSQSSFVSTKSELQAALQSAGPGDTIILKDQAWVGITMQVNCIGSKNDSIIIRSETPGGASLEGSSRIEIGGEYVVIDGLRITNGYNTASAIVFASEGMDARFCRVTNCMIDNWNPPDILTRYHWVVIYGEGNRIDHCQFTNMKHCGVTIMVKAGADQPGHHIIDHNFFGPKPEGDGNGYESIKMGGGDDSKFPLYTLVEKNFFLKCDGETELISNKSWWNTYRYNTFYECQGTLTLRWGRNCLVEGNYFIGNKVENTGGIRITDQNHTVINNYLENIMGKDAKAAISIMSGIPDAEGGDSGHGQTKNTKILHNTIVGAKESINIGYWDDDDLNDPRGDITAPENCIIANNILYSSRGPLIVEDWAPSINTTWKSNILFGASNGIELDSGLIITDPFLEESSDGIMRITENSPAVNNPAVLLSDVIVDFENQLRDNLPDIGADEWSTASRLALPVKREDVGPNWNVASFANSLKSSDENILIYPNPATDFFKISMGNSLNNSLVIVELYDLAGRKVKNQKFISPVSDPEVKTRNLEGHYIVKIITEKEVYFTRVIIKK